MRSKVQSLLLLGAGLNSLALGYAVEGEHRVRGLEDRSLGSAIEEI
jgi:hypothetical protein